MGGLVQEMQPSKLYPHDFIHYINSPIPDLEAYQILLEKCKGKTISDLFQAVMKLVEEENAPDELARIGAGLVYMDDKISDIIDYECYQVVKSVRKLDSKKWLGDPVASCQQSLRELSAVIEKKITVVVDESFSVEQEMKRKISDQVAKLKDNRVKEHPNIGILLADKSFCMAASGMIQRESVKGRGMRKEMIGSLVQEFKLLIAKHGFHIGSRLPGIKQSYLSGDDELDIIEAALFASADNLHVLILHLKKIPEEAEESLSSEEQFYFMNICYAVQTISGLSFLP